MASITLITGSPGSGKSTVGHALAEREPGSVRINVDDIRESMTGFAGPGEFTDEALRQFRLAREVAVYWARTYAEAGYRVIIDDVCIPESFPEHYAALDEYPHVSRVLLNPNRDALVARIRARGGPYTEIFIEKGVSWVLELIEAMPKEGWLVVDSSELSAEETVQKVLEGLGRSSA